MNQFDIIRQKIEQERALKKSIQNKSTAGSDDPYENRQQRIKQKEEAVKTLKQNDQALAETGSILLGSNIDQRDPMVEQKQAENSAMSYMGLSDFTQQLLETPYVDVDAMGAQYMTESASSKFIRSMGYGLGSLIGDYGDLIQVVNAGIRSAIFGTDTFANEMERNNMFSRWLQDVRESSMNNNYVYLDPAIENPEKWEWSNFGKADFWTVNIGRFVPMLAEIGLSMGVGGLVKKAGVWGAKGIARTVVDAEGKAAMRALANNASHKSVLEASATLSKQGFRTSVATGKGIKHGFGQYGKNRGLLKKIFNDRMDAHPYFERALHAFGGGAFLNQRFAASGAANMYNTYHDINEEYKNNYGIELYTDEELSEIASNTYLNATTYMPLDILSFGVTYSGMLDMGINAMKSGGARLASKLPENAFNKMKMISTSGQRVVAGNMFSKATSKLIKGALKVAKYSVPEGFENMIQSSWQEWAHLKAYQEATGSLIGYEGHVSENYKGGLVGGFFDFLRSDDSGGARQIGLALGAFAGGLFNLRNMVNKNANESYSFWRSAERLKKRLEKGTTEYENNFLAFQQDVLSLHFEGKGHIIPNFLENARKNGSIDEESYTIMKDAHDKVISHFEKLGEVESLTPNRKYHLMKNHLSYELLNESRETLIKNHKERLEDIENDPELNNNQKRVMKKKERDAQKERLIGVEKTLLDLNKNIDNIVEGKNFREIFFTEQEAPNGEMVIRPNEKAGEDLANPKEGEEVKVETVEKSDGTGERVKKAEPVKDPEAVKATEETIKKTEEEVEGSSKKEEAPAKDEAMAERIVEKIKKGEKLTDPEEDYRRANKEDIEARLRTEKEAETSKSGTELKGKKVEGGSSEMAIDENGNVTRRAGKTEQRFKDVDEAIKELEKAKEATKSKEAKENIQKDIEALKKSQEEPTSETKTEPETEPETKTESEETAKEETKTEEKPEEETSKKEESETESETKEEKPEAKKETKKDSEESLKEKSETDTSDAEAKLSDSDKKHLKDLRKRLEDFKQDLKDADRSEKPEIQKEINKIQSEIDALLGKGEHEKVSSSEKRINPNKEAEQKAEKIGFFASVKERFGKTQAGKIIKQKMKDAGERIKNGKPNAKTKKVDWVHYASPKHTNLHHDVSVTTSMFVVNQVFEKKFKNVHERPTVFVIDSIIEKIGSPALGISIFGANYINGDHWNQGQIYHHEFSHVYYKLTQHTADTKTFLKYALRNKALVNEIKNTYWDQEEILVYEANPAYIKWKKLSNAERAKKRRPKRWLKSRTITLDDAFSMYNGHPLSTAEWQGKTKIALKRQKMAEGKPLFNTDGSPMMEIEMVTPREYINHIVDHFDINNENASPDRNFAFERKPLEEQSVWTEEVFVETLQGPTSKNYNHLFEQQDTTRQTRAKRWWQRTKNRLETPEFSEHEQTLMNVLNDQERSDFSDAKVRILQAYGKEIEMHTGRDRFFTYNKSNQSRLKGIVHVPSKVKDVVQALSGREDILKKTRDEINNADISKSDILSIKQKIDEIHQDRRTEFMRTVEDKFGAEFYENEKTGQYELVRNSVRPEDLEAYNQFEEIFNNETRAKVNVYDEERLSSMSNGFFNSVRKVVENKNKKVVEDFIGNIDKMMNEPEGSFYNLDRLTTNPDKLEADIKRLARNISSQELFVSLFKHADDIIKGDLDLKLEDSSKSEKMLNDLKDIYEALKEDMRTDSGTDAVTRYLAEQWWVANSMEKLNGTNLSKSETSYQIENSLNYRDNIRYRQALGKARRRDNEIPSDNVVELNRATDFQKAAYNISKGKASKSDLITFMKQFLDSSVDVDEFVSDNIIYINGSSEVLTKHLQELLRDKIKIINETRFNPSKNKDEPMQSLDLSNFKIAERTEKGTFNFDKTWQKFTENVISTEKPYLRDMTYLDANGNQVPSDFMGNFYLREMNKIFQDAIDFRKEAKSPKEIQEAKERYLSRYSMIDGQNNRLLEHWWDISGQMDDTTVALYNGVRDLNTGRSENYSEQSQVTQSITRFIYHLQSLQTDKAGNGKYRSFNQPFADSSRMYNFSAPMRRFGTGDFKGTTKGIVKSSFEAYKGSDNYKSNLDVYLQREGYNEGSTNVEVAKNRREGTKIFDKLIKKSLETEIQFYEDKANMLHDIDTFKGMYEFKTGKNGITEPKLTPEGKNKIIQYELNEISNTFDFNDVFMPSYDIKDTTKRGKQNASTFLPFSEKTSVMMIPFHLQDVKKAGEANYGDRLSEVFNGSAFVLADENPLYNDAGRLGELMKISGDTSGAWKMFGTGVERGDTFRGNNYPKPFAIPLTADMAMMMPQLKPLRDYMMEMRRRELQKIDEWNEANPNDKKTFEMSLNNPENSARFMWAVDTKSVKANAFPEDFKKSGNGSYEYGLDLEQMIPGSEYYKNFDSQFSRLFDYDAKTGSYTGLEGRNHGIQMEIDKAYRKSLFPTQTEKSLNSSLSQLSQAGRERIMSAMGKIEQIKEAERNRILESFKKNDTGEYNYEKIKDFLLKNVDMEKVDPTIKLHLEKGTPLYSPAMRIWALNTLANLYKEAGNRVVSSGTIGHTIPAVIERGFFHGKGKDRKYVNYVTENSTGKGLQDYRDVVVKDENGKIVKGPDGKELTETLPGEVILPRHSEITNRTFARKVFIIDENNNAISNFSNLNVGDMFHTQDRAGQLKSLKQIAQSMAETHNELNGTNKKVREVYHPDNPGEVIGYYIEGDTVMTSRIPSHGVQATMVGEVIDFADIGNSATIVPDSFTNRIDADHDGDAIFVNTRDNGRIVTTKEKDKFGRSIKKVKRSKAAQLWNEAFDQIAEHFLSDEMRHIRMEEIQYADQAKALVKFKNDVYNNGKPMELPLLESSEGRRKMHNDTKESENLIGTFANLHTTLNNFRAYEVGLKRNIEIKKSGQNKTINKFTDVPLDSQSTGIESAKFLQIALDNTKYPYTTELFINQTTAPFWSILTNLGVSLEDTTLMMNHPIMKIYHEVINNKTIHGEMSEINETRFNEVISRYSELTGEHIDPKSTHLPFKNESLRITINTDGKVAPESVIQTIRYLTKINEQIQAINKVTSQHNRMDSNANTTRRKLNKMLEFFDENTELDFGQNHLKDMIASREWRDTTPIEHLNYTNDPNLRSYVRTTESFINDIAPALDPTAKPSMSKAFNDAIDMIGHEIGDKSMNRINNDISIALETKAQMKMLKDAGVEFTREGIQQRTGFELYKKLGEYFDAKQTEWNEAHKDTPLQVNWEDKTALFTYGITYRHLDGKTTIALNKSKWDRAPQKLKDIAFKEFNALPEDIKIDMMLHNLAYNMSNPRNDLSIFFNQDNPAIKKNSEIAMNSDIKMTSEQIEALRNNVLKANTNELTQFWHDTSMPIASKELFNALSVNNESFYITAKNGDSRAYLFKPSERNAHPFEDSNTYIFISEPIKKIDTKIMNDGRRIDRSKPYEADNSVYKAAEDQFLDKKNWIRVDPDSADKIDVMLSMLDVNIDDGGGSKKKSNTTPEIVKTQEAPILNEPKLSLSEIKKNSARFKRMDYEGFQKDLSRQEYDAVMEYDRGISELNKIENYKRYQQAKKQADKLNEKYPVEKLREMSDEELIRLYYGPEKSPTGIAYQNKFAYSKMLTKVNNELMSRVMNEQMKITGRKYTGKDISAVDAWLGSNNIIPSNHPAVQGMIRRFEIEEKTFQQRLVKHASRLNEATNRLYQEQLGYKPNTDNIFKNFAQATRQLFENKNEIYKKLYGPLIHESIQDGERVFRYKTEAEIRADHEAGIISDAQLNFYNETKSIVNELKKHNPYDNGSSDTFIPLTAQTLLESYSRSGLLGVATNLRTIDSRINDVKMTFKNPITGKRETGTFKYISDVYKIRSGRSKSPTEAREFLRLKKKAIELNKKGLNEDGTIIFRSDIETSSILQDTRIEKFTAGNNRSLSDNFSYDLDKSFNDYIYGTLFTNGDSEFGGFKKFLPVVEGIIQHLDKNNNPNTKKYVETVWKQKFLGSKRQEIGKNQKHLETIGISTDKVIQYITNASLVYWLGYKGLALGMGTYTIGNALVGKYKTIVNDGGEVWSKGEKRFWNTEEGLLNMGPGKANKILREMGFMDVNLYDYVSIEKKRGFEKAFMNLALLPMAWSERWIQGVNFLGLLTDAEWQTLKNGGDISSERKAQLEDQVKRNSGRGYQAIDQRMIQMYSWGANMMQFNRYIPTTYYELFAKRDIDRYGKEYVGTYRMVGEAIQNVVRGNWNPKRFKEYMDKLPEDQRKRMIRGMIGFGMISFLTATGAAGEYGSGLMSDQNVVLDFPRLARKFPSASYNMVDSILN